MFAILLLLLFYWYLYNNYISTSLISQTIFCVTKTIAQSVETTVLNVEDLKHHQQAVWMTAEWSDCSVVCGGGTSNRLVYCAAPLERPTKDRPKHRQLNNELLCEPSERPSSERRCNEDACPKWYAGEWSMVSGLPP